MTIRDIMKTAPVIPVIAIHDPDIAVPLAKALVAGGLTVLEITLRTDAALAAVDKIIASVPDAIVGIGTVNTVEQMKQVVEHGARFAVSPGLTPELAAAAHESELPYLPGAMTPGEILLAMQHGLNALKFFPAGSAGGSKFLKDLSGPFPNTVFCPTGGINASTKDEYLALDNVLCVGGSWVAPANLCKARDWAAITELAQQAASGPN